MKGTTYTDRIILSLAKRKNLQQLALHALMKANEMLGLALGVRLAELRDSAEPPQQAFAESEVHTLQARLYHEITDILGARLDKIPERRRPQYTPQQRYRILRIKRLLALSADEIARRFRISRNAVGRWDQEANANPDSETVGSLVKPLLPVRRYADVVRQLVCSMALAGFGGHKRIAETLARAGWKLSKRTVGRMRKEQPPPKPVEEPTIQQPSRAGLRAKYPNHIFMADITEIPGFLDIFSFKLALVLDIFSRMPLCFRLFWKEPTASALSKLMQQACSFFGASKHFVSDQGSQFIAGSFLETLEQLETKQRFGALGKTGSIALIERLWRTLKDILKLKSFKPLAKNELERRITQGLLYYAYFRPHQGLNGATPAEIYFGIEPERDKAEHPPRRRRGEGSLSPPYRIQYLDKEQRLPVLFSKAA